jgi:hypothetical protein
MTAGRPLGDLVEAFRAATLPRAEWTHEAHLRVGAWHVHHHGAEGALPLLRAALFRFWSRERLQSPEARAAWLPPDLAPLRWPPS